MADQFSASELRKMYPKGGSLPDDALSSSELKARHGIKGNKRNFSTGDPVAEDNTTTILVVVSLAVAALAVLAAYFYSSKK